MSERNDYLTEQIITYLGNKRSLLPFIDVALNDALCEIGKDKIDTFDVFSGSGIVSRFLKQYSKTLYTNDLEDYCKTINTCYLANQSEVNFEELNNWYTFVAKKLNDEPLITTGFISKLYAPKDDNNIMVGERAFFTTRNAQYLDSARQYLELVPEPYKTFLLGPLLYEASTKNNTSGVFKGFYKNSKTHIGQFGGDGKNALQRIMADIEIKMPIFSANNCCVHVLQGDSNLICKTVPHVDLAYLDPPYNQHPYGSNYFMLNLINNYIEPTDISTVSGIPTKWNQSKYNKKSAALESISHLCQELNATYILISYNSEGFISFDEMINMLQSFGQVKVFDKNYNTFRGSRNLRERSLHVKEYLFLLRKDGICHAR